MEVIQQTIFHTCNNNLNLSLTLDGKLFNSLAINLLTSVSGP